MAAWLAAQGYCGRRTGEELHARLEAAPAGRSGDAAEAMGAVTLAYVRAIGAVRRQIEALEGRITEQLALHPDGAIFTSLPRSGSVRAAALLAEIGDCRERFPTPGVARLPGGRLALHPPVGTAPGGDVPVRLRQEAAGRARRLRRGQPSGEPLGGGRVCDARRERGKTHPHAGRILARAWVDVIWRCWQDRVPYDPARHGALQRLLGAATGVAA